MANNTALNWILNHEWAITAERLEFLLSVAERSHDQISGLLEVQKAHEEREQALLAYNGTQLRGTSSVVVRDGVGIMSLRGPIFRYASLFSSMSGATSIDTLMRDYNLAQESKEVERLILHTDSPGGEVTGVNPFSNHIFASRGNKPVISYVEGADASAAYWITSATDAIYADATAIVGSIGVLMGLPGSSESKYEIVSSQSPYKRLNPSNNAHRARLQTRVDAMADVFIKSVARNRGIKEKAVLSNYGKGDVFIGVDAVDAGMVDGISSLESLISGDMSAMHRKSRKVKSVAFSTVPFVTKQDAKTSARGNASRSNKMSWIDELLGRKPTAEEAKEAIEALTAGGDNEPERPELARNRHMARAGASSTTILAGQYAQGVATGELMTNGMAAAEREELATLRREREELKKTQAEALANASKEKGAATARELLKTGKILPFQEKAFAAAFAQLAAIPSEAANLSVDMVADDGTVTKSTCSVFSFFESALGAKDSAGWTKEVVPQAVAGDVKAFFNRPKTETTNADGTTNNLMAEDEINDMVRMAGGKVPAK